MRQRGRKSSAKLSVVPLDIARQRPEPPADLTPAQADIWRRVVNTTAAGWFSENDMLLALYCRHAETANCLAKRIDALDVAQTDMKALDRLLRMRDRETKLITHLATKMRLTQQARMHPRTAGRSTDGQGSRPWERQ